MNSDTYIWSRKKVASRVRSSVPHVQVSLPHYLANAPFYHCHVGVDIVSFRAHR